ncbi:MAG: glycosyl hydrolase [Christensenellales bacterium]|jgi:spore germination protein
MNKKPLALLLFLLFLLFLFLIAGIAACSPEEKELGPPTGAPTDSRTISAWLVYWDCESSLDEVAALANKLGSLSYFAAYFDPNDRLFIPESIDELRTQVDETFTNSPWDSYLTIVNDLLLEGGGSSLKDTALLYRLLESPQARSRHAADIIALAESAGYNGIEIDYEAIKKDMVLWEHFIHFISELNRQSESAGIKLRVILESSIDFDMLSFPEGPQYVVMCYNLHGYNSIAGPKADDAFLLSVIEKTASLPGKRSFAIASGGFEWTNGRPSAITEAMATEISSREMISPKRDNASGALFFSYKNGGDKKELWYADAGTISRWISLISGRGDFDIAIWRLGGNDAALWLK